jgi:hypothetical protein
MSKLFSLNKEDFFKGGLMFVGSSVITAVITAINAGSIDFKEVGRIAFVATLTYLLKNLSTDENGKVFGEKS